MGRAMSLLVEYVPQPPEWMRDALCARVDSEIFFPEKGGSSREAKSVCARCLVAAECLEYSLASNEHFGIWGGLSEMNRRKLAGDSWNDVPDDPADEYAPIPTDQDLMAEEEVA